MGSRTVYQDDDGDLWYENPNGNFQLWYTADVRWSTLYDNIPICQIRSDHGPLVLMTENDLGMLEEAAVDSTPRSGLLREAERLITGDRNVTHGEPTANFRDIAELWTTLLSHKLAPGQRITSGDTAMLMVALKLARMRAKPTRDHWVDIAGYAACGFETDVAEGRIKESAE